MRITLIFPGRKMRNLDYKRFYSWPNILRRIPDASLEQKIRFLVFNIAWKKANWHGKY